MYLLDNEIIAAQLGSKQVKGELSLNNHLMALIEMVNMDISVPKFKWMTMGTNDRRTFNNKIIDLFEIIAFDIKFLLI